MNKKIVCISLVVVLLLSMMSLNGVFSNCAKAKVTSQSNEKYALLVGISDYMLGPSGFWGSSPDLPLPASNALDLRETLCGHGWEDIDDDITDYDVNGNIHVLLNHSATKENILSQLDWLKDKEGQVLFFYNGHGTNIPDDDGDEQGALDNEDEALCPTDVSRNDDGSVNIESVIRDDDLVDIFNDFACDELVLLFCTCHSGGMIEEEIGYNAFEEFNGKAKEYIRIHNDVVNAVNTYNEGLTGELGGENRVVMTSCGEVYLTREFNDEEDFFGYMGVPFVSYLIEGLRGYGDINGNNDGQISAEEAFNYMKPRADVLNTLAYLHLLATSPFALMNTLVTAYALIVGVIISLQSFLENPGLTTVLWADLFVLSKVWFDQYGIKLPIAQISDSSPNRDIVLTFSEEIRDDKDSDIPDHESMKQEIEEQLDVLDDYFKNSKSKDLQIKLFPKFNNLILKMVYQFPLLQKLVSQL